MNIVKISGSTAEQMFQYAFYLELHKHDPEAYLDVPEGKWIKSQFKLPFFMQATSEQLAVFGKGGLANRLKSFFKKADGNVFKEGEEHHFDRSLLEKSNTYFEGRFLSESYFAQVADEIKETFMVKPDLLPRQSQNMVKMLSQGKTVAIHVHEPQGKKCTCTPDYYNWAIANVLSSYEKAHFYVFTTDVEWVKANLQFQGAKVDFVGYPAEKETSLLPYLYHAGHNIIANTLISWWAAWLNPNPDKIVIAPKEWSKTLDCPDLIPIYWTTIPTT